jgi:hypothetical protein
MLAPEVSTRPGQLHGAAMCRPPPRTRAQVTGFTRDFVSCQRGGRRFKPGLVLQHSEAPSPTWVGGVFGSELFLGSRKRMETFEAVFGGSKTRSPGGPRSGKTPTTFGPTRGATRQPGAGPHNDTSFRCLSAPGAHPWL